MLTEETKELLRNSILIQLAAARPLGAPRQLILNGVKTVGGFRMMEESDLDKQLRYLFAHKMIEPLDREMNKANECYAITQTGIAWLDEQGLI
jgi:hypothetical protein